MFRCSVITSSPASAHSLFITPEWYIRLFPFAAWGSSRLVGARVKRPWNSAGSAHAQHMHRVALHGENDAITPFEHKLPKWLRKFRLFRYLRSSLWQEFQRQDGRPQALEPAIGCETCAGVHRAAMVVRNVFDG